ncbi:hypothetical protein NPIL_623011 [Nephila pilipes]|uniref:Uncharacterized protein n=1 Tax=Nephila pilipes TaxID=299642 RepID=A0A8X6T607_NEPPI|nr:hypothetical protein NPIL_623011 [Nephila pilipes]
MALQQVPAQHLPPLPTCPATRQLQSRLLREPSQPHARETPPRSTMRPGDSSTFWAQAQSGWGLTGHPPCHSILNILSPAPHHQVLSLITATHRAQAPRVPQFTLLLIYPGSDERGNSYFEI